MIHLKAANLILNYLKFQDYFFENQKLKFCKRVGEKVV